MTTLSAVGVAPQYDLSCDQGYDLDFAVTIQDQTTGLPVNLTGYTVEMVVKAGFAETAALITAATNIAAASYITLNGALGKATIHLDHADTALLAAPRSMVYDLRYKSPGNAQVRYLWGTFYVKPQVTPIV